MPLSPENNEKLKKIVATAVISAAGYTALQYARKGDGFAYAYLLDKGRSFKLGFSLRKEDPIKEIAGDISSMDAEGILLDEGVELEAEEIDALAELEWRVEEPAVILAEPFTNR